MPVISTQRQMNEMIRCDAVDYIQHTAEDSFGTFKECYTFVIDNQQVGSN